jgi:hypothetical protein
MCVLDVNIEKLAFGWGNHELRVQVQGHIVIGPHRVVRGEC